MKTARIYIAFLIAGNLLLCSCKKFIEVPPPRNELTTTTVFATDESALSVLTGMYSTMMQTDLGFSNGGITMFTGLSSDELLIYSNSNYQSEFYENALLPSNSGVQTLWRDAYKTIYAANTLIEASALYLHLSEETRQRMRGEAKFVRAFIYFYLVNLFGDVPLVVSTDYQSNAKISRNPSAEVYSLIISDLQEASNLLSPEYVSTGRARPNKWAAHALLARVYLFTENWAGADEMSTSVIAQPDYNLSDNLKGVFEVNSNESIWQLAPVIPDRNTSDGFYFVLTGVPTVASLSPSFINKFETGDLRAENWIRDTIISGTQFFYPYKYKVKNAAALTEYYSVLRLAEQYLIRAESRLKLGNLSQATDDVNVIRARAGLQTLVSSDADEILRNIQSEREHEFFTEWGHRWLDIKRYGKATEILEPVKSAWESTDELYPIPLNQMMNDPNIVQNPGY